MLAIIQARVNSTRLPGKALLPIGGTPSIQHTIERAWKVPSVHRVTVTVPEHGQEELLRLVRGIGATACDGPHPDMRTSYLRAMGADQECLRIWGDCPFIDPQVCEAAICVYRAYGSERVVEVPAGSGFPVGWECQVFSRKALERAVMDGGPDPEVVFKDKLKLILLPGDKRNFLLDTAEDYHRLCAMVAL